jgi:hypothetical protein
MNTVETRTLSQIMSEMKGDMNFLATNQKQPTTWRTKYWAAVPYIDALSTLTSINDKYGYDDAKSLVLYLLGNLGTYRGDKAKELKAELKKMAGVK